MQSRETDALIRRCFEGLMQLHTSKQLRMTLDLMTAFNILQL